MIDPLIAIIGYLAAQPDLNLVNGRIAAKHKFAMGTQADTTIRGWPTPSQAMQLSYTTGEPQDLYAAISRVRLDVRCYGGSQVEAAAVYGALTTLCDAFVRSAAETPDGRALIYWIVPDDSPVFDKDPDTGVDFVQVPLRASVARDAVV